MTPIYQKYINRGLLTHLGAILSVLVLLIWFSRAVSFISYITDNGVEIKRFLYLFVLVLPWIANYIIPISLFVASLVCFSRLSVSNEITILKGCGLSNFRIAKSSIYLGLICSFFCYLNSFYLTPFANKKLRISRNEIYSNYVNITFNPQTFETFKKTTIYSQYRDPENNLYGVFIYNNHSEDASITITARSGKMMIGDDSALMYLNDGTMQRFNNYTRKSEILKFDNYVFNLAEKGGEEFKFNWKPGEKYFYELFQNNENLSTQELLKIHNEIHKRIIEPLTSINLSIIAVAFLLRGQFRRRGGFLDRMNSVIMAVSYVVASVILIKISENNKSLLFLPYVNFFVFFVAGIYLLNSNKGFSR